MKKIIILIKLGVLITFSTIKGSNITPTNQIFKYLIEKVKSNEIKAFLQEINFVNASAFDGNTYQFSQSAQLINLTQTKFFELAPSISSSQSEFTLEQVNQNNNYSYIKTAWGNNNYAINFSILNNPIPLLSIDNLEVKPSEISSSNPIPQNILALNPSASSLGLPSLKLARYKGQWDKGYFLTAALQYSSDNSAADSKIILNEEELKTYIKQLSGNKIDTLLGYTIALKIDFNNIEYPLSLDYINLIGFNNKNVNSLNSIQTMIQPLSISGTFSVAPFTMKTELVKISGDLLIKNYNNLKNKGTGVLLTTINGMPLD